MVIGGDDDDDDGGGLGDDPVSTLKKRLSYSRSH